jgi:hypothetical protein
VIRRILHALICIAAALPWLAGMLCFGAAALLAVAADRLWPKATWGNCWTHAFARWAKYGGYIGLRSSDTMRLLKVIPVPHVMWIYKLHKDCGVEQIESIHHVEVEWFPWMIFYFPYRLISAEEKHPTREKPHDAGPDSSVPPA